MPSAHAARHRRDRHRRVEAGGARGSSSTSRPRTSSRSWRRSAWCTSAWPASASSTRRRPRRPLFLLRLGTALVVAVIGFVAWKVPWFELLEGVAHAHRRRARARVPGGALPARRPSSCPPPPPSDPRSDVESRHAVLRRPLQLHPARARADRDVGALPGVRRHGGLRRRARAAGHLARGAPRGRQRLEPVAAGDGGARVRPHQDGSWPRSTRSSHRCTIRSGWPRTSRCSTSPAAVGSSSPPASATARASTRRTARTGRAAARCRTRRSTPCSRRGRVSRSSTAARRCSVTPRPFTQPHPTLMLGGSSKVAVRRAARFGLPYLPPANLPELEAYYYEQCAEFGTQGFCAMPPEHTAMTFVAEDPERVWRDLGHHFFEEASTYSPVAAAGADVVGALPRDERRGAAGRRHLRGGHARGARRPAEGRRPGRHVRAPPARRWHADRRGWCSLRLYVDEVLPALG